MFCFGKLFLCLLVICASIHQDLAEKIPKNDECSLRFSTCMSKEKLQQKRAVCGTDNQTYPSKCHLQRVQCEGVPVTIKHRGRCKESQPCWMDLNIRRSPDTSFAPKCNEDGSFAPVQCHEETGYCWCVTRTGKPIPESSVRYSQPNCQRRSKSNLHRRSPSQGRRQRKDCERNERAQFNNNLITKFKTEYNQEAHTVLAPQDSSVDLEHSVLSWKFSVLDIDRDDYLDVSEYRDLRQMVRKSIKPKKCSKIFTRLCDKDNDERISRDEWSVCLGLDFSLESQAESRGEKSDKSVLQGSITPIAGLPLDFDEDSSARKDEMEASDCLSDRKAVLEEQLRTNTDELYIPECMPDGRFQKKQCYRSTGYCWCVHEKDGRTIPGTSIKNQDPQCDSIQMPSKQMSGCPENRRQVFLKELTNILKQKLEAANKTGTLGRNAPVKQTWQTPDETAASWIFFMLDKNHNQVLEKKEWKNFRPLFFSSRHLRKCGKRFPRFCDANYDRKISLTEWLSCMNPENSNTNMNPAPTPASRRKGMNPLQIYLIGEN